MKKQATIASLLFALALLGCTPEQQAAPQPPNLISGLSAENLAKANAILPDYAPPWCETEMDYDLIVDARFVKQDRLLTASSEGFTSTAHLHIFDVVDQVEGSFPHPQLKFIRILNLRDGVKYKLLTLRGTLRFWLTLKDQTYTITNIGPIPNKALERTLQ